MKQFSTVFRFELMNYLKKKSFLVVTILLVVAMGIGLSIPRIMGLFGGFGGETPEKAVVLLVDDAGNAERQAAYFTAAMPGFEFRASTQSVEEMKKAVDAGDCDSAVLVHSPLSYTRIVRDIKMMDNFSSAFEEVLRAKYQADSLQQLGASEAQAQSVLNARVQADVQQTSSGKNQMMNFFYTYILIFLLYFAIMLYGQFVATSVATEKSSRAMELLITSTRPKTLMFGKVFGAGAAGIAQFVLILGSGFLFYNLNKEFYAENPIVQSIFNMPLPILLYCVLFFVLGFFLYAFIYGALGSLVSRMEELATTIAPISYVFVIAFVVVMFSMGSGNVDNAAMIFCSYFPLTSPMAMFTRIAMGNVAGWEIIISVVILVAATAAIGYLAAAIYRMGVLMYGKAPKLKEVVKMLRNSK